MQLPFVFFFFFFNDTATTEIYTLSLHDALPIYADQVHPLRHAAAGSNCFRGNDRQPAPHGSHCQRTAGPAGMQDRADAGAANRMKKSPWSPTSRVIAAIGKPLNHKGHEE